LAQVNAIGEGPVAYSRSTDGRQLLIPLTDIVFDAGEPKSRTFPADAALTAWLKVLVAQDRLRPAPQAPAATSMTVEAKRPGVNGNSIVVMVAPNGAGRDITVRETDTYHRVVWSAAAAGDEDFLPTVLGSGAVEGTLPGLLKFNGPVPPVPPVVEVTEAVLGIAGPLSGGKATFNVPPTVGAAPPFAFGLIARDADVTGTTIVWDVAITDVVLADKTFTLTVTWSNTMTIASAADLPTLPAKMAASVAITVPAGAALPAVGTYQLYGGAEEASATAATATILASS
jgi:hypothetical protein